MVWTTPETYSPTQVLSKTNLDKITDNLEYLKSEVPYYAGVGDGTADWTETLTTWAAVGGPFTTGSVAWRTGHVLVWSVFNAFNNQATGTNGLYLTLDINGTKLGGANGIYEGGNNRERGEILRIIPITAGTYAIALYWKVLGTGTITLRGNGFYPFFMVRQIDFTP